MNAVKNFIETFQKKGIRNTPTVTDIVSNYIKETLEVKTYLPFAEKRELCAKVLNTCNTIDRNSGLVKVDSVSRYIVFTIAVISAYTNLEFSSGEDAEFDSLDEYDMLCQSGLLNPILEVIGAEYVACNDILNMMMSDVVANNNTIENVLGTASKKLLGMVDELVEVLREKMEDMELDFDQIDIEKYAGLMEKLGLK